VSLISFQEERVSLRMYAIVAPKPLAS